MTNFPNGNASSRFNTQPPEGGWIQTKVIYEQSNCFNTQPPEGGWYKIIRLADRKRVSTHSRPKAAGFQTA